MELAPRTEADSKVNMDCSRFWAVSIVCHRIPIIDRAYVESSQGLAVSIELVVVELNELLCWRSR